MINLDKLNKEQREAVENVEGPCLVLAGAGSGKTRVLTTRIAYLIEEKKVSPYAILAITFTNKAAKEMKERLISLIGDEASAIQVSTFHSFGLKIVRENCSMLGYEHNFVILDSDDTLTVVKKILKELNLDPKTYNPNAIKNKISGCKNELVTPEAYERYATSDFEKVVLEVYKRYQKTLKKNNSLDFDDLLILPLDLFRNHPSVLEKYQDRFQYILIDEYQDTNEAQYILTKMISAKYRNICVVGDPDQCLIEGTMVEVESGCKKIEDITNQDKVKTVVGSNKIGYKSVENISKKKYQGKVLEIETESGRKVTATPNHVTFIKIEQELNVTDNNQKTIDVTFLGGSIDKLSNICSSRIAICSNNRDEYQKFQQAGFSVRKDKGRTWRIEMERKEYDDAEKLVNELSSVDESYEINRRIRLTNDSYHFMPFSSLRVGMVLVILDESSLKEERITKINTYDYDGYVYDINVSHTRNYFANQICVHNCIYSWRGANYKNILNFEKDYKEGKTILLEENYRSTTNILDAANCVIKNNQGRKEKNLWSSKGAGDKISYYRAYDERDEAFYIIREIKALLANGVKEREIAVLYRTNAQSHIFEEEFLKANLPFRIVGSIGFYSRKEIKDLLSYLRLILNEKDNVSLMRVINVPKRGIGLKSIQNLVEKADKEEISMYEAITSGKELGFKQMIEDLKKVSSELTLTELVDKILDTTGYKKELEQEHTLEADIRLENLEEFKSITRSFEEEYGVISLEDFLLETSLISDVEEYKNDKDRVSLMTVHSVKGLEFDYVFVTGLEEGIFPHMNSLMDNQALEEERRLCYVAITRAREKLYLLNARKRMLFGRDQVNPSSRFLREINQDLILTIGKEESNIQLDKIDKTEMLHKEDVDYQVGDYVFHDVFGAGRVVEVSSSVVSVAFKMPYGIKKLMKNHKSLKKV